MRQMRQMRQNESAKIREEMRRENSIVCHFDEYMGGLTTNIKMQGMEKQEERLI